MSRVVHKYEVVAAGGFDTVPMPIGAEILHADVVESQVFVWALVEQGAVPLINRRFGYFGTGHPVPEDSRFVATGIDLSWNLVWHVFEEMPGEGGSGAERTDDEVSSIAPPVVGATPSDVASTPAGGGITALSIFGFDYWDEPGLGMA